MSIFDCSRCNMEYFTGVETAASLGPNHQHPTEADCIAALGHKVSDLKDTITNLTDRLDSLEYECSTKKNSYDD